MPKAATVALMMTLVLFLSLTLRPTPVAPPASPSPKVVRVVVDAGHGGKDPGASIGGVDEKDLNLALALRVAALARSYPNLEVVLTRDTDRYLTLEERLGLAHRLGAAAYISIHGNSFPQATRCGVETLVDTTRSPGDPSYSLAEHVQREVVLATGAQDLGVRRQPLYLSSCRVPAVLVEVGHLSCPAERIRLLSPAYQDRLAKGILQGILEFLGL